MFFCSGTAIDYTGRVRTYTMLTFPAFHILVTQHGRILLRRFAKSGGLCPNSQTRLSAFLRQQTRYLIFTQCLKLRA